MVNMPTIAIDSAKGLKYTGCVSGSTRGIIEFYSYMENVFTANGVKHFHWHKINRKKRQVCRNDILQIVNKSNLKFNILLHKIPTNFSHKEFYLKQVPYSIAENLIPWIKSFSKDADIDVFVNEDYNIRNTPNGTDIFIDNFLIKIGLLVADKKPVVFTNTREDKKIRATVKNQNGNIIDFYACKSKTSESKEIQIIDIILGYFLENSKGFDYSRIHFKKI